MLSAAVLPFKPGGHRGDGYRSPPHGYSDDPDTSLRFLRMQLGEKYRLRSAAYARFFLLNATFASSRIRAMLDSFSISDEFNSPGLEDGSGMRRGPVLLDKENSGATHKPSTCWRLDLRFAAIPEWMTRTESGLLLTSCARPSSLHHASIPWRSRRASR